MKKKIKNFGVYDVIIGIILLFPFIVPLFTTLFTSIAYSGQTGSFVADVNFMTNLQNAFSGFSNILGLSTFNTWMCTYILNNSNPSFITTLPLIYFEYVLFVYFIKLAIQFLLILPNICSSFFDKMGGDL